MVLTFWHKCMMWGPPFSPGVNYILNVSGQAYSQAEIYDIYIDI